MPLIVVFVISLIMPGIGYTSAQAQTSQTLYFMDRVPQSVFLNPAHRPGHNFYIGLPMISSLNINAKSNFASFSDLVFKHPQYDSLISFLHPDADTGEFISKLRDRNTIGPDLNVGILSFGFRVNSSYFSFSIAERASFSATLPRELILLALQGNEQFAGRTADFSNLGGELNYYREYAAGYSLPVNDRLTAGGRAKLLFGKANFSFADKDISLYTDPGSYNMRLRSKFTMNFSMPVTLVKNENGDIEDINARNDYEAGDFIFNSGNAGAAIDLGATYRLSEPLMIYASITDLGFINWKQDVYNLSMDGDFEFAGLDLSPVFSHGDDSDPGDNLLDSLKANFRINDTGNAYLRGLPARIYLGATYGLTPGISLGLLSRSEIYHQNIEQAVTLSANATAGRWLSYSVSYTAMNHSYDNLGMGLSLRGGGFNFYVLSDNILSTFTPHRVRNVNLWFGFNLAFGRSSDVNLPI